MARVWRRLYLLGALYAALFIVVFAYTLPRVLGL